MIRTFTKGKLRKEIIYVKFYPRQCNAWNHVVSMHGSGGKGRILIERERQEEFGTERQAKERFRQWAAELIGDGWECLEGMEVEFRDKSEVKNDSPPRERVPEAAGENKSVREIRKCEVCDTEFVAYRGSHRYCSVKCKRAARILRERTFEPELRKCEWCGKEFMAQRKAQRYCSTKCCVAAAGRRYREKIKQQGRK